MKLEYDKKYTFNIDFRKDIREFLTDYFNISDSLPQYIILRKTLDARGANRGVRPKYLYQIIFPKNAAENFELKNVKASHHPNLKIFRPIIIGAGPAGMFCAKKLSESGIRPIIFERGSKALDRMKKIAKFWRHGVLDPNDNVCFGEGGAGLYSDGKLITRIKSPYINEVMQILVSYGAPPEIEYISNPHLGSNKIRSLIANMAQDLKNNGVEIVYNTKVEEIIFDNKKVRGIKTKDREYLSDVVILASGHSADDLYYHLEANNVAMKAKPFAVGIRIEHPRGLIDSIQYGKFNNHDDYRYLGAARYKLTHNDKESKRGTYSFCMCPGGHVLNSSANPNSLVTNGMSNFAQNSPWSNAAVVTSIDPKRDFDDGGALKGLDFLREIESYAFKETQKNGSGKELLAQNILDYIDNKPSKNLPYSSCPSKLVNFNLNKLFIEEISNSIKNSLIKFNKSMPGLISKEGLVLGPETRTSSPVTIIRDKEGLMSISHHGLYPGGEGAGYAGGITSAACDGMKIADQIIRTK